VAVGDGSTWSRPPNRLRRLWSRLTASSVPAAVDEPQAGAPRANQPLVASLVEAMPYPAIALDEDLRVLAFNAAAREIVPAIRLREPVLLVLRAPELVEAVRRADSTDTPQRVEMIERVPPERWFEVFVNSVPSASGRLLLMSFNDRTPLRRVEEMRADFVANASHELRTPLAALLGFVETLQGPAKEDAAARERFLGIMQQQAARMARLIDDLLSLSRIELNAHLRPKTPLDLGSIVRQVIDGLQPLARDRAVEVKAHEPAEPVVVLGDRDELIRALENLVENALKYGASGKRVDLTLSRSGGEAHISVRDYGPGIAPEHLPRLTERFYRVDVADSRSQGGTGLGLALVKHVLNRHGGRVTIESRRGEGATFTLHLPMHTAPLAEMPK
jgi:two-component system, OmpR family, phosphate regulon sensor histidine kinase PhoR